MNSQNNVKLALFPVKLIIDTLLASKFVNVGSNTEVNDVLKPEK